MPTGERLLRLFPRGWRDRYGQEFLATVGDDALGPQQVIDIVSAAIDAWLSGDVRRVTATPGGGGLMTLKSLTLCERTPMRYTVRDGLIAAAVMFVGTMCFTILGGVALRNGWPATAGVLRELGFIGSFMLSMPFWVMKGQPWKVQTAIVGGSLVLVAAIGYL